MTDKWYSKGLSKKDAERIGATIAKIQYPVFRTYDDIYGLMLEFGLSLSDGTGINRTFLTDMKDVEQLLKRTKAYEVSKLEGKIIEAYVEPKGLSGMLKGISVNENLI